MCDRSSTRAVCENPNTSSSGNEVETVAPTSCAKQEALAKTIDSSAFVVMLTEWGNLLEI